VNKRFCVWKTPHFRLHSCCLATGCNERFFADSKGLLLLLLLLLLLQLLLLLEKTPPLRLCSCCLTTGCR